MSQLKVVSFNGQLVTDSRDVAEMVGKRHDHLFADIKKYADILDSQDFGSLNFFISHTYRNSQNKEMPCYLLTRKGCDMVANKMTGEKGVLFTATYVTRFEEMEQVLNHSTTNNNAVEFEKQLIGVKYATEILRVDEPSKIRMLEEAHKKHGVPTNHLPAYVKCEELKVSLTQLLKEHDVKVSAAKANTRLIELGLLETKERPSSKGGTKEFKSLTEAGRKFGDNAINPHNQKETQLLYYPSMFNELLELFMFAG